MFDINADKFSDNCGEKANLILKNFRDDIRIKLGTVDGDAISTKIIESIISSPRLLFQFDLSSENGDIYAIKFEKQGKGAYFWNNNGSKEITITEDYYDKISKYNDANNLLKNDIVLLIGHELSHAERSGDLYNKFSKYIDKIKVINSNGTSNITGIMDKYVNDMINDEALADIKGWNDLVDSEKNRLGRDLTDADINLILSLNPTNLFKGSTVVEGVSGGNKDTGWLVTADEGNISAYADIMKKTFTE